MTKALVMYTLTGYIQYIMPLAQVIGQQFMQWADEFKNGSGNHKAKMIGKAIGAVVFELIGTKGAGVVARSLKIAEKIKGGLAPVSELKYFLKKNAPCNCFTMGSIILTDEGEKPTHATVSRLVP